MPSAADDDAAQWRHVAEVPAPSDDDVAGAYPHVIGRIEIDPAERRTKHRNPRMRGIGSQVGRAGSRRRRSAQIAADVASRQAPRAQAREHDVGEILADAAASRERLERPGPDVGGAGRVAKTPMNL